MSTHAKTRGKFLIENDILSKITSRFERSPIQLNKLLESDAEIISINNETFLAVTIDGIVEEISTGLYKDPYLLGWMTVMVSLSDLAAVGANFLGLLLLENIPKEYPANEIDLIQKGIQDACSITGTFILGGDTNTSRELQLSSVAIGTINDNHLISRVGCKENDLLFVSNSMGLGMGYAFQRLFGTGNEIQFRPLPDSRYGQLIRKYASCCMDSSDGFFPAVCNLMELNSVGFKLEIEFKDFIHKEVNAVAKKESLPEWFFLAGPHGEFELVFTIPPNELDKFLESAKELNWSPLLIGSVVNQPVLLYPKDNLLLEMDVFKIANLFIESGGNPRTYFKELNKINKLWN